MNPVRASKGPVSFLIAVFLFSGVTAGFAADQPKSPPSPTKEMRQQMAAVHEKMAACLRSDRPFAECRDEMQKTCHDMMGEHGCPMMGMGMHGHDRMMKQPADSGR